VYTNALRKRFRHFSKIFDDFREPDAGCETASGLVAAEQTSMTAPNLENTPMRPALSALLMIILLAGARTLAAESWPPAIEPIERSVDLNVGESCDVKLADGSSAAVKLVDLKEIRDDLRQAVREARVTVEVNGQQATLLGYNYHLPITVGGVQIDCSISKGCVQPKNNPWSLDKDARLRLWPAGSPWIQPGTFLYPMHIRWFSSLTHMANEPVYADGDESPAKKDVYYHWGLDTGGAEELADIYAATDAIVAAAGLETIVPKEKFPSPEIKPRYDVIYLLDGRGWYYRYSHLSAIDPAVKVGAQIKMGQKIGTLGKEGASGGWSHLHFDIVTPQPSGRYGISDAYAFFWQAYQAQYHPQLQAVARPHHLAWVGDDVVLDGSLSWSAKGPGHIASYQWSLTDGRKADGATVTQRYPYSGEYSEILKVTDDEGRVDYDFAIVQVIDREHPELLPPAIHAVYWPTFGLKAGDVVIFKVRSFDCLEPSNGRERWNFGDGTKPAEVQSVPVVVGDKNKKSAIYARDGYATTTHRFAKPGDYLVSVSRTNSLGQMATGRLVVHIEP
jgi:hypothetical protein